MFLRKAVQVLLISAILLHGQLQLSQAYTKVSTSGSSGQSEEGPKIYKALNFDLIFPKSFNSSENVISTTPSVPLETGSPPATVVVDGSAGRQQHNPLPQSNEQTNRDDNGDVGDVGDRRPPLYITPSPNEAALYQTPQSTNSNSYSNTHDKDNNAQVVTQNPINIQQQQQQRNDNNNNNGAPKEQQQNIATGRAVDYHTGYPFGQLITPLIKNAPRPVYSNNGSGSKGKPMVSPLYSTSSSSVVYPQAVYQRKPPSRAEIDKLRGRGPIKDRFTPSEAVASHQIKASNHHHNHAPTYANAGKIPSSSNVVNTYVPPKNIYSFPPNNVDYPSPMQDNKLAMPSSVVNSYSPPPSGSHDSGYSYAGPLNLGYLPSINGNEDNGNGDAKDQQKDNNNDDGDAENGDMDDSIGVLPASAMGGDNNAGDGTNGMDPMMPMKDDHSTDDHHDDHSYDTEKEYPTPPPEWLKAHPEALNEHSHDEHEHEHEHNHDHHNHDEDHQPDIEFDHDHDHHHHPDIIFDHDSHPYHHEFPSFPIYPHYPEIIYDGHHHHEEPPPTTTEAPPPEPPPEPRVKKYSYFYIGRKLWYIPLYFTVWFSFYVLWLILKSIARHKVNLPNHYVSRRSVDNYNLSKSQQEVINQLTISVMDKIEKFKRKHLS